MRSNRKKAYGPLKSPCGASSTAVIRIRGDYRLYEALKAQYTATAMNSIEYTAAVQRAARESRG